MQYAVVVAALVAAVAATDEYEVYEPTTVAYTTEEPVYTTEAPVYTTEAPVYTTEAPVYTTEAPVYTTEVAPSWSEWESIPASSDWEAISSIPVDYTTKKPADTTTWAVWSTEPAKTTSAPPKYTGAANKANMVGAGAVGLAAVAFML